MATSPPSSQPTTLNIPSLIIFTILSVLAIRYFFFNTSSSSTSSTPSSSGSSRRIPADRIEQVAVMFPQLSRRDIEYDLSRNGANVAGTTERVLREGRLPGAPASFMQQQIPPPTQPTTATTTSSSTQRAGAGQTTAYKDLITRYGLSSKVGAAENTSVEAPSEEKQKKGGWSQNKTERQALLKKRREDMILEARRKLEEKDRAKGGSGGA